MFQQSWMPPSPPKSDFLAAGWRSVTGNTRSNNEDHCAVDLRHGVFLVADGVGGHFGGAEASELVCRTLMPWMARVAACGWRDADVLQAAVEDAVEAAREEMIALASVNAVFGRMAATMAMCMANEAMVSVTHVGDCRVYRLRRGRLQRLTADQSFVHAAIEAGLLTEESARDHPWRHMVTNTVGVKPLDEPMQVDEFDLAGGDRLLLCSDGLTDVVDDESLRELLIDHRNPQSAADALIDAALAAGSTDNITSIVVEMLKTRTDLPELVDDFAWACP